MSTMVRDVMTQPVVAVRRDASFKEMAARLRQYRVSAFPVIDENHKVIGVVSEADLLAVFDRTDAEIHAEIVNDVILRDFLVDPAVFTVTVAEGVVTVQGTPETADLGHNLVSRIRHLNGVVAVRDELTYPSDRSIPGQYF